MAKESFYFSHDYNARNDEKILELRAEFGAEGYGVFWMAVETMAENENCGIKASLLGGLSLGYGVAKDKLSAIIKKCIELNLFYENEGYYFSNRLLAHKELRNKLSEGGKKGADSKWAAYRRANGEANGEALAPPMQRKEKERKEKENKEKNKKKSAVFVDLEKNRACFSEDGTRWQELGVEQKKLLEKIGRAHV